jgi:diadenosine tetraphosphate (Ap4A) HIT family hydrolase
MLLYNGFCYYILAMNRNKCLICERIEMIQDNKNSFFVRELKTGYVVIGDHQFFRGYTLFLCKQHKKELHELDPVFRKEFLWEMSEVASAVFRAFNPRKLNYELLGNVDQHMHWHLFPRYDNDPQPTKPVWSIDKSICCTESTRPSGEELENLRNTLYRYLTYI